jgi:hypothetical protein
MERSLSCFPSLLFVLESCHDEEHEVNSRPVAHNGADWDDGYRGHGRSLQMGSMSL